MAAAPEVVSVPELGWREVDALLKYWGGSRWRVGLCGGYPEQSAVAERIELYEPREWFQVAQITAQGKQNPHLGGHRVLYDAYWAVSKRLLMINAAVNLLPDAQFLAVVARYAIGYMSNKELSCKEQADMLEITPDALDERLRRARRSLGRMLVNIDERRH